MAKVSAKVTAKEPTFSKAQFLESSRLDHTQKDILDAILVHGQQYTIAQVDKLLSDFLKRKVK